MFPSDAAQQLIQPAYYIFLPFGSLHTYCDIALVGRCRHYRAGHRRSRSLTGHAWTRIGSKVWQQ
ncbi:hypothetical protein CC77DRAFT_211649 [Alternaria alternata]|uniref:Uncharacterized protein n=1 Tax=Alternaria alternata TaxID=5599 RepID=A0A177DEB0_ALTAL|nr:hypothetical protein CC77DRAFT_211649 [Alternaria alternata]OAG18095.1 hypothetical protein CC77DRAFT_211649 [Alternaria alternata]